MIKYSYREIQNINQEGILFKDGFKILFEECRYEWAKKKHIKLNDSYCIAERNSLAIPPYFLFYTKEGVTVYFENKGFIGKRNRHEFQKFQLILNQYGFSSYDLT